MDMVRSLSVGGQFNSLLGFVFVLLFVAFAIVIRFRLFSVCRSSFRSNVRVILDFPYSLHGGQNQSEDTVHYSGIGTWYVVLAFVRGCAAGFWSVVCDGRWVMSHVCGTTNSVFSFNFTQTT